MRDVRVSFHSKIALNIRAARAGERTKRDHLVHAKHLWESIHTYAHSQKIAEQGEYKGKMLREGDGERMRRVRVEEQTDT